VAPQVPTGEPDKYAILEGRYREATKTLTQTFQERAEMQRKLQAFEGIDPEKARAAMQAAQQQAEASKLKPWNKGHPEHTRFQAVRGRVDAYRQLLASAKSPEQQQAIRETMGSALRPEEISMLEEAEADRQQFFADMQADPRGFMANLVQEAIRGEIQRYDQYRSAASQAETFFTDPSNAELIKQYAPMMQQIMADGMPKREQAVMVARLMAENEKLKAQVGKRMEDRVQQEAQDSARRAVPGRQQPRQPDPADAPDADPVHRTRDGAPTAQLAITLRKIHSHARRSPDQQQLFDARRCRHDPAVHARRVRQHDQAQHHPQEAL
jgi:hypothetical protein